jgi:hypothetical protein
MCCGSQPAHWRVRRQGENGQTRAVGSAQVGFEPVVHLMIAPIKPPGPEIQLPRPDKTLQALTRRGRRGAIRFRPGQNSLSISPQHHQLQPWPRVSFSAQRLACIIIIQSFFNRFNQLLIIRPFFNHHGLVLGRAYSRRGAYAQWPPSACWCQIAPCMQDLLYLRSPRILASNHSSSPAARCMKRPSMH